jgi:hypothetical protein
MCLAGLDDHDVKPEWQLRDRPAVPERPCRDDRPGGVAEVAALAEVDCLLGKPEPPRAASADLDDHEARRCRRTGVDGDQVDLVTTDAHVSGEDRPALR